MAGCGEIPILAMTASAFVEDRERCLASGMNDFIAKPIDPAILHATLARWIQRPRVPALLPERQASTDTADDAHARQVLASIPGLDLDRGLKVVRQRATRLLHFLARLIADHRGDARLAGQLLAEGRHDDALRVAHTLKGLAGTLGLTGIHDSAAALETALQTGGPSIADTLTRLQAALDTLAACPVGVAPGEAPETLPARDEAIDWGALRARLLVLRETLERAELTSAGAYEALRTDLEAVAGEAARTLGEQVNGFEFEAALETVSQIQSREPRLAVVSTASP